MEEKLRIIIHQREGLKIHTFISPRQALGDATHIIETKNQLVLIDAQLFIPYAKAFREYANSLKKPIKYIFISHSHPDHYFGLSAAFSDIPSFTYQSIQRNMIKDAPTTWKEMREQFGKEMIPDKIHYPANVISPGKVTIDGLLYQFSLVREAEDEDQMVIRFPEVNAVIMQDLTYNGYHLYLGPYIEHWISFLREFYETVGPNTLLLVGHGPPGFRRLIHLNIDYLQTAKAIIDQPGMTGPKFKDRITSIYPKLGGSDMIHLYFPVLFPTKQ